MKTFKSTPMVDFKVIFIIFVIASIIFCLLLSHIMGVIIGLFVTLIIVGIQTIVKIIFYKGQYGVVFSLTNNTFTIKSKKGEEQHNIEEISEFSRFYVQKYGQKMHIKVGSKVIKFFTPDVDKIEMELIKVLSDKKIPLKKKKVFLPYVGITYQRGGKVLDAHEIKQS